MANVRGTGKHTYSVDDRLGQGATCNVFKGLSKDGEFHALKIFEPHAVKDINREIAALQKLKHENIIRFVGVEHELMSRQVVVVMEFCEGGSLASYLQEPDNMFGLPDTDFLLLLKHMVSGMEHLRNSGFVHRDIKPGNILRCINKDGSSLFKLSDFGTARPLEDDEFFKSLVGTEEYLHPEVFNAAFINEGKSLRFPHSVDLWSLGATLYNAATGDVPFCPFHRRRDRTTMYEMITKKPAGVIGARQDRPNGEIQWLYELPDTSQLSGGLQKLMEPLLVALFERDPRRVWTFEGFFQETQTILAREPVAVLALFSHHSPFDAAYLPLLNSVAQLKEALCKLWNQPGTKLHDTLYGESHLSDWLHDDEQLFDMPPTDSATPIIPLPASAPSIIGAPEPSMSKIVSEELQFSGGMADISKGREMCGIVALIHRRTAALALFQQHLLKLRHRLRFQLRHEMRETEKSFHPMTELFDVIRGTADMTNWTQQEKDNFEQVRQKMTLVDESLQGAAATVKLPFEDNQWNFDGKKCTQETKRAKEEVQSWLRQMKARKTSTDKNRFTSQHNENCLLACRRNLEDAYKRTVRLWSEQCFQKTTFLRDSFLDWYRSYLEATAGLQVCQENLHLVVSLVSQLFKSCVNRSQGHKAEMVKVSKSLFSANNTKVDRSQLMDLKSMMQDLTNNLEALEVFNIPPK
ncbi:inhibitor of nuclear factor kappa-B kinase subunit epsilon-like [Littorina saxatilis]|uniref:Protein kinase domain-containing protein n=1 Tax=Littorina saxatilis TaxID=31220 RepID=A0AAN9GBZ4_9CAEN